MTPQPITPQPSIDDSHPSRNLGGLLGLLGGRERPFPLQRIKVRTSIAGDCCRTVVEQSFANPYAVGMEAVHIFPLPEDGAVTEMELRAGDVIVRAECRERAAAEEAFRQARESGRRAALLTQERADVHTLRVTNVPPKTGVTVRMVIIERLEVVDGRYCWRFPTVVAPRYIPGKPISHDGDGAVPDTDRVPDASRIQPPLRLAGGTELDLEVSIRGPLTSVESSLHAVRIDLGDQVRVAPSTQATLNKDFILWFAAASTNESALRAYTDGEYTIVVVEPPADASMESIPRDAIFLIDTSFSMSGTNMEAAKRALSAALHGLESADRFRLLAFDSELEAFSAEFLEYNDRTLADADHWIKRLVAAGGTEILPAVKESLAGPLADGRLRTILLITDGQVCNADELARLVAGRNGDTRLFTVGIDTAVNSALLKRLARLGGGTCELLTPDDDIEIAIAKIESRFGSPILTDVQVADAEAARPEPRVVFDGRPISFMVAGSPSMLQVTGRGHSGSVRLQASPVKVDFPLGALWARQRVAWLEDRATLEPTRIQSIKEEIIEVALKYGIASRYTAFVAVESVRSNNGELIRVVQPVELPEGWNRAFTEPPAAGRHICFSERTRARVISLLRFKMTRRVEGLDSGIYALRGGWLRDFDDGDDEPMLCAKRVAPDHAEAADVGGRLARAQQADGSFGGDVGRSAAALVALILDGNTRKRGPRRRVVFKLDRWLKRHADNHLVQLATALLERAEGGGRLPQGDEVQALTQQGPEGDMLMELLADDRKVKTRV